MIWRVVLAVCLAWGLVAFGSIERPHAQFNGCPAGFCSPVVSGGPPPTCTPGTHASTFLARTSGLNTNDTNAYCNFINGLDTDSLYSIFDILYLFNAPTATIAQLNVVSTSYSPTLHGSPTFAAYGGYNGASGSSTIYIDTNYNPSIGGVNFTTNGGHFSIFSNTAAEQSNYVGGNCDSSCGNLTVILPRFTDGNTYLRINELAGGLGYAVASGAGFFLGNRSGTSAEQAYYNGSLVGSPNGASGTLQNIDMYLLCPAFQSSGCSSGGSNVQLGEASWGGSMNSTQVGNFNTLLAAFNASIGH